MLLPSQALAKKRIPVFIVAGQSNTDGRVRNSQLPDYIKRDGYRHTYWCYNNAWYSSKGEFKKFWPWIYNGSDSCKWAYDAVTYYYLDRSMQSDYYVIKESRGGTAISTACPTDNGFRWSASPEFLNSTAAADKGGKSLLKALCENIDLCIDNTLSKKGRYDIRALIWHQGESDRNDAAHYYDNVKAVITYIRQHIARKTGCKRYLKLPVIVGGISHKSHGFSQGVEDAQRRLQKEDSNFHFIDMADASIQPDMMHFDAASAEQLGKKVYEKLKELGLTSPLSSYHSPPYGGGVGGWASTPSITWFDGKHAVSYNIMRGADPVVGIAARMFAEDMRAVTGMKAVAANTTKASIKVIQLDRATPAERRRLIAQGVPADSLSRMHDAFSISVVNGQILLVGANGRGCAYALLEMSRKAGVSPWIWWGDVVPECKPRLTLDPAFRTLQGASVEYRGIFINDEDWSLRPWSYLNNDPAPFGEIGARTYRRIFELLLRLRANAFWPAMHERTKPFFQVEGARAVADSFSIALGSSHCEALLRNNVGEWDKSRRDSYNYISNTASVQEYWAERLREVRGMHGSPMLTIGMRGIHDGSMEGVHGDDQKLTALQRVIDDQQLLIARHLGDPKLQTQIFIPYKEVLDIYRRGLRVPDYATLMWCDDNYGYITRLSDTREQQRSGGAGVYYHLSYWGQPHDYLWLATTQPGLICNEMLTAYRHNARRVWIANVHDPKAAAYQLELFLDMAWNIHSVTPSTVESHYASWLCRLFGPEAGLQLLPVMKQYYRLCAQRRPEFMGWSECENYSGLHDNGLTPVRNSKLSEKAFGGELQRYLDDYAHIAQRVKAIASCVSPQLRDAYFAAITYPVCSAEAHARKMLWAQRARTFASHYPLDAWQDSTATLMHAVAESQHAYREIRQLTEQYNNRMAGGKWRHSMSMHPRSLPVFAAPSLPLQLTDDEVEHWLGSDTIPSSDTRAIELDGAIVRNAADYNHASKGVYTVQMLGHSMRAVAVPEGDSVEYVVSTQRTADAVLRLALIPTQPNNDGDLRFTVSVDGAEPTVFSLKEPFRSNQWKQNVLRQQALRTLSLPNLKAGQHRITVKALDPHLLVDQLMIDYDPRRSFYLFPIEAAIAPSPLDGKTINVIGDSYVRNHQRPVSETWHYKLAQRHHMTYRNYGVNGSCIAFDRTSQGYGKSLLQRLGQMNPSADYVLVIAGHNDAHMVLDSRDSLHMFRDSLATLCTCLRAKYPKAIIAFVTPWSVDHVGFSQVLKTIKAVCSEHNIPVLDAANTSGIRVNDDAFRTRFFQNHGKGDHAHLNNEGHNLLVDWAENFLEKL